MSLGFQQVHGEPPPAGAGVLESPAHPSACGGRGAAGAARCLQVVMLTPHLGNPAREVDGRLLGALSSCLCPSVGTSLAGDPRPVWTPSQEAGCLLGKGSFPPSTPAGVGVLGASVHRVAQAASWKTAGGH